MYPTCKPFIFHAFLLTLLAIPALAQDLPDKIRGYKVYIGNVSVVGRDGAASTNKPAEALVTIGEPEAVDISLTGITIEVPAEILASGQSGKVHFLTFHDFKINGVTADIEEYRETFAFETDRTTRLPKPVRIFLRADRAMRTAWRELTGSKEEWTITGRIFVFGKFKKMGFSFKRVVPVDISIKIKNPLIDYRKTLTG